MVTPQASQKTWHCGADLKRHQNRIANPFLAAKERGLVDAVVQRAPANTRDVLDLGCGEGSGLGFLRQRLPHAAFTGVDFSFAKVRHMARAYPETSAVCADATRLPFGQESFDLVMLRDLLHHVDFARETVVAEAWRVLRPGGVLAILETDGRHPLNRIFRLLVPVERGMANSTPLQLRALLAPHGPCRLDHVEPSLGLRAVGFVLGWPSGFGRLPARLIYGAVWSWERLMAAAWPRTLWPGMLLTVAKE